MDMAYSAYDDASYVTYIPRVLSGRLSCGAERGHGRLVHMVKDGDSWGAAVCGAKPGRLSGSGFVEPINVTVTCPKCRKRLAMDAEAE
jgi:hypothetical protein